MIVPLRARGARRSSGSGASSRSRSAAGECCSTCGSSAIAERTLPGRGGRVDPRRLGRRDEPLGVAGADALRDPLRARPRGGRPARVVDETAPLSGPRAQRRSSSVAGAVDVALGRVFGLFDALAIVAVIVARSGHRQHALDERPRAGPRARRAPGGRDDPQPGPPDRRRRGRHPGRCRARSSAIVTGLVAGALMIVLAGGDAPRSAFEVPWASIGLAAAARRRPVDAGGLVSGPPRQPPRDREGRPARVAPVLDSRRLEGPREPPERHPREPQIG